MDEIDNYDLVTGEFSLQFPLLLHMHEVLILKLLLGLKF